ncbi:MAG: nucleoside deaminase [Rhodanobacteraceae bacterium]
MDRHGPSASPTPILPEWVADSVDFDRVYADDASRIALAIELAQQNVAQATGGPFGAAVFDAGGLLISIGVNRVEALRSSLAHAEIIALVAAQRRLGRARLHDGNGRYTLATSAQPCCQCFGAIVWAAIDDLLIGARAEDTESLTGFDEGPLPEDWAGELERRGVRVVRDLQRGAARRVLKAYAMLDGARY